MEHPTAKWGAESTRRHTNLRESRACLFYIGRVQGPQKRIILSRSPPHQLAPHAHFRTLRRLSAQRLAKVQSGRLGVVPGPRRSCPFVFILLRTLCPRQKSQPLCNQANPASFQKTPGVWGPLPSPDLHESQVTSHKSRPSSCAEAQKCPSISPLLATLTHSLSRKSFPCHSDADTRDGGAPLPKFFSPLAIT